MYKLKCSVCGNDLSILLYSPSKVLYECPHCKITSMIKCANDGIVMTLKNVPQVKQKSNDLNKDSSTAKNIKPAKQT